MSHHSSWLTACVDPATMRLVVKKIGDAILEDMVRGVKIDAIAVRGVSGAVIGGALSVSVGLPLVIVRKPNDGTHSCYSVEYGEDFSAYAFVDDLISSGSTLDIVRSEIKRECDADMSSIYLYRDDKSGDYGGVPVTSFWL